MLPCYYFLNSMPYTLTYTLPNSLFGIASRKKKLLIIHYLIPTQHRILIPLHYIAVSILYQHI